MSQGHMLADVVAIIGMNVTTIILMQKFVTV